MKTAQDLVAVARQQVREIALAQADDVIREADLVLDVREPAEFQTGHIPGAVNIPRGLLEFKMDSNEALANREQQVVIYCKTSGRAALAALSLHAMGYLNVQSIAGGFDAWVAAGKPQQQPQLPEFG